MGLLPLTVALYLGDDHGWVDVTDDVRVAAADSGGGVTIVRGRAAEATDADPTICTVTLKNVDGSYSPRNPTGKYYGLIGRNTPMRVSMGPSTRAVVEVSSWPPRWDRSGADVWVPVQGAGVLRRLSQGAASLRSPLRRTFISYNPAAYLPLEDGVAAARPASAADGIAHGTSRDVEFGVDVGAAFGGTAAAARMTTTKAMIATPVRAGTDANGHWSVGFYMRLATQPHSPSGQLVMRVRVTGGSVARYELSVTDGSYWWRAYDADDNVVANRNVLYGAGADPTGWVALALQVQTDPVGTRWAGVWHGVGDSNFWATVAGGETLAGPIGRVTSVELHGSEYALDALFAHLIVTPTELPFVRNAFRIVSTGFASERAGDRILRLTAEAGVAVEMVGDPSLTELCGPQRAAPLVELLQSTARVDGGILQESRSVLGLVYRTRHSLYNQTPLPISYAGHISEPFEPVDDDDAVVNDVTVSRVGGSSARATATSGPLSTAAPPRGVGIYDTSVQLDVHDDGQLPDQAGWRLHLGTVDEARYPQMRLDLTAPGYDGDLAAAVAAVDAGDVLALTDLPPWLPPGPTAAMVQGYTEVLDADQWAITVNATPAAPWDVAVADGPQRVGADGSAIVAVSDSALTMTMTSTAVNGAWTVDPADFPMDLRVGGERVTATGITGTGLTQTVTLSARAVNGVSRSWPDGTEVQVWAPAVTPL
ncbi:hypothetical protein [Salinispora sp. H7-4]|uniref:hypothetical protein n=1 Tax=Salinispora sp. H7-4 TaxID=2748321 RepID=UPI0021078170|nr:hypothetical protein [Salinispora sp. H7-4]